MQYSRFFCGREDAEYSATASDLRLLEQGFRLTSVQLSFTVHPNDVILYEMQSAFVRAEGGNSSTMAFGPVHGAHHQGGLQSATLYMTPYSDPIDPNDRIVAVSTCCTWPWESYDSTAELVLLKTEGGLRVEPQPGGNNW